MANTIEANLYRECSSQKLTGLADLFVSVSGLITPLEGFEMQILPSPTPLAKPYAPPQKKSKDCTVM